MSKEQIKNELRELTKDLIGGIKLVGAVIEMEHPGCGHLALDVMAEEMDKLRKKPEPEQGDTCQEGPGCCKCPCDAAPCKDMTFGDALEAMKDGERVAREGWNGKNMYVFLAHEADFVTYADISEFDQLDVEVADMLVMKTAQNTFQPGWLASQADMLAEDWYIVE